MSLQPGPRFNLADAQRAHDEWGCNCGPGALAAIMNLTLDEVRPHIGDFESKRYTNPTLMFDALESLNAKWVNLGQRCDFPVYGLCRVQWEGPWTNPGVPIRARYRHTHWIGAAHPIMGNPEIFDINVVRWISFDEWANVTVPWLLNELVPRANGKWHLTHVIEITR